MRNHSQRLTIDLNAIVSNWRAIAAHVGNAETAAVVKANAYGLGIEPVAKAFSEAGVTTFFVAYPFEAAQVRSVAPHARIFVLNGFQPEHFPIYAEHNLHAIIGSHHELHQWQQCTAKAQQLQSQYALHFDTGMNRLGFDVNDAANIAAQLTTPPALIMSHLACADEPEHPLNALQLARFKTVKSYFPNIPASLANSAGALLGREYCFDLVRPGIALYGGLMPENCPVAFKSCLRLEARILQLRTAKTGETIGYGAQYKAVKPTRIAILSIGYADGLPRHISVTSGAASQLALRIAGYKTPVLGRISMDLTAVDISEVPEKLLISIAYAEIFGVTQSLAEYAKSCNTITYEVLTSLSQRAERTYI